MEGEVLRSIAPHRRAWEEDVGKIMAYKGASPALIRKFVNHVIRVCLSEAVSSPRETALALANRVRIAVNEILLGWPEDNVLGYFQEVASGSSPDTSQ